MKTKSPAVRQLLFILKWLFMPVYGLFVYLREMFYLRIENGAVRFIPSSKKMWAQFANLGFMGALYLRYFGTHDVSARITDALIGILAGHAVSAMAWYGFSKGKDVQNALHYTGAKHPVGTGTGAPTTNAPAQQSSLREEDSVTDLAPGH